MAEDHFGYRSSRHAELAGNLGLIQTGIIGDPLSERHGAEDSVSAGVSQGMTNLHRGALCILTGYAGALRFPSALRQSKIMTERRPNLPPLFEDDDWLWVAQSLGHVQFSASCLPDRFEARHRMDRIIAKILEYRIEDVRREHGK